MQSNDSRAEFIAFLGKRGLNLDSLNAASAVDSMLDFYAAVRADDVDLADGGDMVLFQWGTWDWGDGPSFEYDLTRQFIVEVAAPDDADGGFWQLSLTLHFEPVPEFATAGSGDQWCSNLDEVDDLRRFIDQQAVSGVARRSSPLRVELRFGPAG